MIPPHRQGGAGLIEVLIAIVLLATALLGFARLQLDTLKNQRLSDGQTQAQVLAFDLSERIRANPAGVSHYVVAGIADSPVAGGCTSGCNAASVAAQDLNDWRLALERSVLALGNADVEVSGAVVTITLEWQDSFSDTLVHQPFSFAVRQP